MAGGGKYSLNDQRTLIKQHFGSGIGTTVVTQTVIRAYRTINNIEKLSKEIELPDGTKRHATFNEKVKAARFVKKNDDFSIESSSNNNGIYFKNGLSTSRNHTELKSVDYTYNLSGSFT